MVLCLALTLTVSLSQPALHSVFQNRQVLQNKIEAVLSAAFGQSREGRGPNATIHSIIQRQSLGAPGYPELAVSFEHGSAVFEPAGPVLDYLGVLQWKPTESVSFTFDQLAERSIAILRAAGVAEQLRSKGWQRKGTITGKANGVRFEFERLFRGVPIMPVAAVEFDAELGTLEYLKAGSTKTPPLSVAANVTPSSAFQTALTSVVSGFTVCELEVKEEAYLHIRSRGFVGVTDFPISALTLEEFRRGHLMYRTTFGAPGYKLASGTPTTEEFQVYIDALSGSVLAVTPPTGVISASPAVVPKFDWQSLSGTAVVQLGKSRQTVRNVKFGSTVDPAQNLGKTVVLGFDKRLIVAKFDVSSGILSVEHDKRVVSTHAPKNLAVAIRKVLR